MGETLKSTLVRLDVEPGDVLLIRAHPDDDMLDIGKRLQQQLRDWGMQNLVLVAHEGASVELLDPDTMAAHGWYRKATKRPQPSNP